jgi:hypothetical protein
MRVADGALKAAYRPGRETTFPMAGTVRVKGSMAAVTVLAATVGVAAAVSFSPPLHAVPSSNAAVSRLVAWVTATGLNVIPAGVTDLMGRVRSG